MKLSIWGRICSDIVPGEDRKDPRLCLLDGCLRNAYKLDFVPDFFIGILLKIVQAIHFCQRFKLNWCSYKREGDEQPRKGRGGSLDGPNRQTEYLQ